MAESLIITDQNFAGTFANTMITRTTLDMATVKGGNIFVIDGIKKKYSIPRLDVSGFVQDRAATPISQGEILVDRTVLEPEDYMVYLEFNPRDYETHWFSSQLNKNLLDAELPQTANSFTVFQTLSRLGEWNERGLWRSRKIFHAGNANYALATSVGQPAGDQQYKYFDGIEAKLLADATVLRPSGTQYAITTGATYSGANGFYPFQQCLAAVAASEFGQPLIGKYGMSGCKFHVNINTQLAYQDYLTSQPYKNNDTTERGINKYLGYEVVVCPGMSDNTVLFTVSMPSIDGNLFLGMNSKDDESNVLLNRVSAASELFFIKILMKADATHGYGDLACLYTTLS